MISFPITNMPQRISGCTSFLLVNVHFLDRFLEQNSRVNAYVVLLDVADSPSIGVVLVCTPGITLAT